MNDTTTMPRAETRTLDAGELRAEGRRLTGYAAVFDTPSDDLGGFTERIAPGAFTEVLASSPDVHLTLNHDESQVLARTLSGTLRLREDARGLRFEADLPNSPLGDNVREAVGRGDVTGASFRFVVGSERWVDDIRTVFTVAELHDVTVATRPAYPAATVELRATTQPPAAPAQTTNQEAAMSDTTLAAEDAADTTTTPDPAAEDRTEPRRAGALTSAEDRTAGQTPDVATRLRDAMLATPKGEARALTTAAAVSREELSTFLFDRLRGSSVALQAGITVVQTQRDSVQYPQITADVTPGWYAEAATLTAGDPTFATITATPKKLAHLVQCSNEVIDDSDPSAVDVLRDHLIRVLGLKLDLGIFEGTGSSNQPTGIENVSGIGTVSMGTNGATPTTLDPFADAIGTLLTANAEPTAIVMHPRTWGVLIKIKEVSGSTKPVLQESAGAGTQGVRRSIYGVPVYLSAQLSITKTQGSSTDCSNAYVVQADQVVLVNRQDVAVELDRSRLFNSDQSELRAKLRADVIVPNPTAVAKIVGIRP